MPMGLAITCVSRLLPLIGIGRLSAKRNLHSLVADPGLGLSPQEGSMSSPELEPP
jgi:hypothetical protein